MDLLDMKYNGLKVEYAAMLALCLTRVTR